MIKHIILIIISLISVNSFAQEGLSLEKSHISFGNVKKGEVKEEIVNLTNTTSEVIMFIHSKGECGASPKIAWDPVQPGETVELKVTFDTKNMDSSGLYIKCETPGNGKILLKYLIGKDEKSMYISFSGSTY